MSKKTLDVHPCFNEQAHFKYGRTHLPVAPRCNIQCKYCIRSLNAVEQRPGVACRIMAPREALAFLRTAVKEHPITVVGVAGPGDALANEETFETFRLIGKEFPQLLKCLSTNGLLLSETINLLREIGLDTLTVTVNAVDPKIGARIYESVSKNGKTIRGVKAAETLIDAQLEGVAKAVRAGMRVKINTVLIPGVNMHHVSDIAKRYAAMGVHLMNIMPLIPLYKLARASAPSCDQLNKARNECEKYLPQFRKCKQCRADAVGIPGREVHEPRGDSEYYHF